MTDFKKTCISSHMTHHWMSYLNIKIILSRRRHFMHSRASFWNRHFFNYEYFLIQLGRTFIVIIIVIIAKADSYCHRDFHQFFMPVSKFWAYIIISSIQYWLYCPPKYFVKLSLPFLAVYHFTQVSYVLVNSQFI